MRKIGLFIFLIITCLFFSSTYCGDEYNFFNVQFINNSGSDIRLFLINIPNKNYPYDKIQFDEYGDRQYKVKDKDTIYFGAYDDFDIHLFILKENAYNEILVNSDFDKILFEKHYLLKYSEATNGHIVINYKE